MGAHSNGDRCNKSSSAITLRLKSRGNEQTIYVYTVVVKNTPLNCSHKPIHQVNQVSASTKFDHNPLTTSNNPSSFAISIRFEVISQLDEVSNK